MRVLLDTCVVMDAIQAREPFAAPAQEIFRRAAASWFVGCLTAKSITDIYYLTHRCTHSDQESRAVLTKLFALFDLLDTAALDCKKAVSAPGSDYEDAVMMETAASNGVDCIVTRNQKDYKHAAIPVLSPDEFLEKLDERQK